MAGSAIVECLQQIALYASLGLSTHFSVQVIAKIIISWCIRSHLASIPFALMINEVNFLGTKGIIDTSEVSRQDVISDDPPMVVGYGNN